MGTIHYINDIEKRKRLGDLYNKKASLSDIAILLEISQRTAYKELDRGFVGYDCYKRKLYDPRVAQSVFEENLSHRGRKPKNLRSEDSQRDGV